MAWKDEAKKERPGFSPGLSRVTTRLGRDKLLCNLRQDVRRRQNGALRRGPHVVDRVAGRKRVTWIHRAGRQFAVGSTAQVRLQVRTRRSRGVGGLLALFQGPLLLGRVNQPEVVDAGVLLRSGASFDEV